MASKKNAKACSLTSGDEDDYLEFSPGGGNLEFSSGSGQCT